MKSKTRWLWFVGIIVILMLAAWKSKRFLNDPSNESNTIVDTSMLNSPPSNAGDISGAPEESSPSALEFAAAHLTPILFYGKVVDQNGNPVPDAQVEYSGNSIPWGGAARQQMKTDANGEFRITSTGISLSVNVSKENYRSLLRRSDIPPAEAAGDPFSSDSFNYAKLFGPTVHKPDSAHPVIFTLHKSGVLEPLITQRGKDWVMAKDGSPVRITLDPGNPKTVIELQCWTDDKTPNAERHYDWRFKLTVPSGGLEERPDEIAFTAPATGYEERSFDYSMKKELPGNQWRDEVAKSFFVRFEDDTYAILDVNMISGGDHFVFVSSRLNPKTGSRNLETAPPKKRKYR
jgi:hypothetical protein